LAEELEPLGLQFRLWWNGTAYYLGYGTKGSEYAEAYIMTEGGGKQRIASGADLMLFLGGI
jgi:hypothetical protein